ncbi:MAG: discoidin domain-containing protein, partial [Planctomycetota bacterium]
MGRHLLVALFLAIPVVELRAAPPAVLVTAEQIEDDWLRQAELRFGAAGSGEIRPEEDARGGNDGVKDGKNVGYYGFHTDRDSGPWWHVDLGAGVPLARAVIYNGSTEADAKRALGLAVLLSADGESWREVYRHDGSMFCGPDQPLSVDLAGKKARYLRVKLPYEEHLHLDEVEVYRVGSEENAALGRPSTQSSTSKWSIRERSAGPTYPIAEVAKRGLQLAENLRGMGVDVAPQVETLREVAAAAEAPLRDAKSVPLDSPDKPSRDLYLRAQWAIRNMALANPLLDFDDVLFVKRAPNLLLCHCDEYLSWWSRPGGEVCLLEGFRTGAPRLVSLTAGALPPGDVMRPDVSHDGTRVLFAYCRHYPEL